MSGPRVLAGRYELDSLLGRGGMAEVYLGTDRVLGRRVAVKVLSPEFARDSSFVARFRREAQSAAALNHPNVVSVFDTGSDDGTHFIVMEYVEGRTLAQVIREDAPLLPERAVEIASAVAMALAVAHEHGIVHRDVKPGNIMLTRAGDVKVMDFGIARAITGESLTQTATVLGTATYLSPEQAQGEAVDARSDLYSLGVVLYEMLTGTPPFTGESPVAVAYRHVAEDPVPPSRLNPDVPPDLDAVVLKCLAKNPANRYQTARELAEDLERVRRGAPVTATPLLPFFEPTEVVSGPRPTTVLPAETVPEAERGRRWAAVAIAVLLLALVAGLGLFFLARSLLSEQPVVVAVPDVRGSPLRVAREVLEEAGFRVGEVRRQPSDQPEGTVLDYEPKRAAPGTPIDLTVSAGPERVAVPDVVCTNEQDARRILEGEGLRVLEGPPAVNEECPFEGFVATQDPPAGEEVPKGSVVTIQVNPAPTTTTTVPTTTTTVPPTTTTTVPTTTTTPSPSPTESPSPTPTE
ncbi:MAG TPA: Stk1 family PASTA domain-containing Ser/Thr kinase [Actinomycetota bacterium]|nr:Stk1 family PASTA domain-containing Ser/Thr kinase [Actinomycetota bacterium]